MFAVRSNSPTRSEPDKKNNYRQYKPNLKIDFDNSCGYCGVHHVYFGAGNAFHIDHFAPKSIFKELETAYSNLVYSCPICNIAKSNIWVGETSDENIKDGVGFVDPCDDEYDKLFFRNASGKIKHVEDSSVAEFMYRKMKFGLKRHELFWLVDYFQGVVRELQECIEELEEGHPLKNDLNNLFMSSVKQMSKYSLLTREI